MTEITPIPKPLLQRYRVWKESKFPDRAAELFRLAREGQAPDFMMISCSDSRVQPTDIFGAEAGDMFVHRNIANFVPPLTQSGDAHGTSAAVEYGVRALKVRHLVVLGHAQCGGVQGCHDMCQSGQIGAALDLPLVGQWLALMRPAHDVVVAQGKPVDADELSRRSVVQSLQNLLCFPFVADAVAAGSLQVHGAWFDFGTGVLLVYQPDSDSFEPA